jgi:NADPH:quinone reductase-like Zn-dependent oxidoreductase
MKAPIEVRQLRLIAYGDPAKVVELRTYHIDHIDAESVLVAVEVAPIHPSDFLLVAGRYGVKPNFPAPIGAEGVGIVVETGAKVDSTLLGKRVAILPTYEQGTWASHVAIPVRNIVPVSGSADPVQLAQISINALTSYVLLRDYARLMPGNWVGQTAANSTVGQYIIALAGMAGLKTLNVVRRPEAAAFVKKLGGDKVVILGDDLEQQIRQALDGKQLDLVLDTLSGTTVGTLARFLKDQGSVVGYASESGQIPTIASADLFYRRLHYHGFWVIDWLRNTPKKEIDSVIGQLSELISEGKLSATVGGTYEIEQYKEAFQSAQQSGRSGKFFFTFKHQS